MSAERSQPDFGRSLVRVRGLPGEEMDFQLLLDLDATLGALIRRGSDSAAFERTIRIHEWKFGVAGTDELLAAIAAYEIGDDVLARITCPALALAGEGEGEAFTSGLDRYRGAVAGPVSTHVFAATSDADAHCQVGNSAELCAIAWDWLDALD